MAGRADAAACPRRTAGNHACRHVEDPRASSSSAASGSRDAAATSRSPGIHRPLRIPSAAADADHARRPATTRRLRSRRIHAPIPSLPNACSTAAGGSAASRSRDAAATSRSPGIHRPLRIPSAATDAGHARRPAAARRLRSRRIHAFISSVANTGSTAASGSAASRSCDTAATDAGHARRPAAARRLRSRRIHAFISSVPNACSTAASGSAASRSRDTAATSRSPGIHRPLRIAPPATYPGYARGPNAAGSPTTPARRRSRRVHPLIPGIPIALPATDSADAGRIVVSAGSIHQPVPVRPAARPIVSGASPSPGALRRRRGRRVHAPVQFAPARHPRGGRLAGACSGQTRARSFHADVSIRWPRTRCRRPS